MNTFLKALEQMAKGVRQIDIGDMAAKPNVGARMQAVQRLLEDATNAATKADDWGWKGAPKGKLSASDYVNIKDAAREDAWLSAENSLGRPLDEYSHDDLNLFYRNFDNLLRKRLLPIAEQWEEGGILPGYLITRNVPAKIAISAQVDASDDVANAFLSLQAADIPWEYTGKVFKALAARDKTPIPEISSGTAYAISRALKSMTTDQRSEFLSLLPEWNESIEELVEMLRTV